MTENICQQLIAVFSQTAAAWVSAIATLFIYYDFEGIYAFLTKRLLEAQTQPQVVATVVHDAERASMLQIVIKNIGHGLAKNIRFRTSRPIPAHAWGMTIEDSKDADQMTAGPIKNGITVLAPGDERRINWGQYGGLVKNLGSDPVKITCIFENSRGKVLQVESHLDVNSFETTAANTGSIEQIANHLKRIAEEFSRVSVCSRKLKVELVEIEKPPKEELQGAA